MTTSTHGSSALERPHEPAQDASWQESAVLVWWDERHGIGGFHRIGQAVHRGQGNLWCGVATTAGHSFRRNIESVPLTSTDRSERGLSVAGQTFAYDGQLHLLYTEPDVDISLDVEDQYPLIRVLDHAHDHVAHTVAHDHLEASGTIRGTVRLGSEMWEIEGLCHRDRSWGPRDWGQIHTTRWVVGSCGPTLSFAVLTMIGRDGRAMKAGVVIEDGAIRSTTDLDVLTLMEDDGVSHRGGQVVLRFAEDELRLVCEPRVGWHFSQESYLSTDTLCTVLSDDGRTGFCDFELGNGRTTSQVHVAVRGQFRDGLQLPA